jgi:predicted nucleotidyltransferase
VKKIKQELPHAKVFLFGSQANNTARPNSDYDIGILDDKPVPLSVM